MSDKLLDKLLQYAENSSIGGFFKSLDNSRRTFLILLGLLFYFGISIKNQVIVTQLSAFVIPLFMAISVCVHMSRFTGNVILFCAITFMQFLRFSLDNPNGIDIYISLLARCIVPFGLTLIPLYSLMIFCFKKQRRYLWFECGIVIFFVLEFLSYLFVLLCTHLAFR